LARSQADDGHKPETRFMPKRLTVLLVGRICIVTERNDVWAVFVDARSNRRLALRDHVPLLTAPMSMVASQRIADEAKFTSATFVNPIVAPPGAVLPLIDSMGIWSIAGNDMRFTGIAAGARVLNIQDLPDLNAIMRDADPAFRFEHGILDDNPRRFAVSARLKLPSSGRITAVTEDSKVKNFVPGKHAQAIASFVRCEFDFKNDQTAPSLVLRRFGSKRELAYRFDARRYMEIPITMSNLCNCAKPARPRRIANAGAIDDPEFALYYELLQTRRPNPPPLPVVPLPLTAAGPLIKGIEIPECYDGSRLAF
jgi:hypothetical protein